jgi:hypothetical protein
VTDVGLGLEAAVLPDRKDSQRVRLGACYLFGPDVTGWSISVGLQY